jgi:hypothetical protein
MISVLILIVIMLNVFMLREIKQSDTFDER